MALNSVFDVHDEGSAKHTPENTTTIAKEEKVYLYTEAINLAGNGWYSISLTMALTMSMLGMGLDILGFSIIVNAATCELDLDMWQTNILLSMPFIGPIVMAYPWGYISDTQGRKKSLIIAMWSSFVVKIASSFSPNWITLAILKFLSTSLCSCAQSSAYALLGESCHERIKDFCMLIVCSVLNLYLPLAITIGYFVLNPEYTIDLGLMIFTPWRILICILGLPLGLAGLSLHFFYESPKFLLNLNRDDEALKNLRSIWRRNGRPKGEYSVKRVCLNEEGNISRKDMPLVQRLWGQFLPLFRPPLLKRSLQLYFILAIIYIINNGYLVWFPYLADKFVTGLASLADNSTNTSETAGGFCNMISVSSNITDDVSCSSHIEINLIWSTLTLTAAYLAGLFILSFLTQYKRNLSCIIFVISACCAIFAALVTDNIISFIMFIGLILNELCLGFILSYIVDLYPTSYRGMAACIGAMVSRGNALIGVNVLGEFTMSNCSASLYTSAAMNFAAAAVTLLLPRDKPTK